MSKVETSPRSRYMWMLVALTAIMFVCVADESRAADYTWNNGVNSGSTFVTNPVSWNNASGAATNGFYLSNNALIFTNSYNQTAPQTFNWDRVNVQVSSAGGTSALAVSGYTNDVIMTNVAEWRFMSGNLLLTNLTGLTGKSAGTVYIYNTNNSALGTSPTFAGNMGLFLGDLSGHGSSLRTVTQNLGSLCISNFGVSAPNSSQTFTPGTMTANLIFNGSGTSTITGTIYSSRLTNSSGATNNSAFTVSSGTVNLATTNANNASTNSFAYNGMSGGAYGWNSGLVITNNGSVYIGGQNSLGAQAWNIKMGTATGTTTFGVFGANEWANNLASTVSVTNNFDFNNSGAGTNIFRGMAGKTFALSGVIASANTNGTLVFQDGAITLSGANTFSNLAVVNNSAVTLSGANASLGNTNAGVRITGTGALDLGGLSRTNGAFTLDTGTLSNGTLIATSYNLTNAGTVSAILSGSGTLTKSGAGTAVLAGDNNFSGGTTISGGTLQLGNGGATGTLAGNVTNNATLAFNRSGSLNFASSVISGSGALTIGGGTITLGTNNTFGGIVTVDNGAVASVAQFGTNGVAANPSASSFGTGGTGTANKVTLNGGTVRYTGAGESGSNNVAFTTNGGTIEASGTGKLELLRGANGAALIGDGNRTITFAGSNTMTNKQNATITNSATGITTVAKRGTGNWEFTSSSSAYTGGLDIYEGRIIVGGSAALSNGALGNGDIRIYNGGGIRSSSTTIRVDSTSHVYRLGGSNYIDWMDLGKVTLTNNATILGNTAIGGETIALSGNSTTTILGSNTGIEESGGSFSLTKAGAALSTLILNNTNNYSGGTFVSSGTLIVTNTGTLGASTSAVTISGGTLDLGKTFQTNGTFTIGGGVVTNGTVNATSFALTNAGTVSAVLEGSGALTKSGAGTATLTGANTYSGGTLVSAGTLLGDSTSLQKNITNNATVTFNQATNGTYSGVLSGSGAVIVDGGGLLTYSGNNTYSGTTTITNATLKLGDNNALGAGGTDSSTTGTRLVSSGILDLNGKNIANEALAMNSSSAIVTNSSATTAIWGGAITLSNNSNQFNVASGKDITLQGSISGSASRQLMKNGDGVLTVAGSANTNQGIINVNAGTFRMGNETALGANAVAAVNVADGATLDVNGYTATASSKTINLSGTGVSSAGALQNSSSGSNATVNNEVILSTDSSLGGAGNMNLAGDISGSAALDKVGSGRVTLLGSKSYTGATTVRQGTLLVDSTGSIASSSSVTVNAGLLNVNGTAGAVTVNIGGSLGGSGTVGAVTLKDGSFLKPGNSPGLLTASLATWEAGSTYNWEIDNADGTAGINWDLFSVTGALDLSDLSSSKKMNLVLASLSTVTNFSATTPDSWVFAQAGSLVGNAFTAGADVTDLFNINATAFNNGTVPANGWRVEVGDTGKTLNLMAVPEPSTGSMFGLGLAGLVVTRLLRRKNS